MKPLIVLTLVMPFLVACSEPKSDDAGTNATAATPVKVTVTSSADRIDYPASNTIDGDHSTFMTTPTLTIGSSVTLTYQMPELTNLSYIELFNKYTYQYNLGDLEVYVSADSTNGFDGNWWLASTVNASNAHFKFNNGYGMIELSAGLTRWVKLKMTYTGTGAYGSTPAFYLSEVRFMRKAVEQVGQ